MPGPSRINLAALMCSALVHASILGGLILVISNKPPRHLATNSAAEPIVIDLIPSAATSHAEVPSERAIKAATVQAMGTPVSTSNIAALARSSSRQETTADVTLPATSSPETTQSGSGGASPAVLSDYQRQLYEEVALHSRYPAEARRKRLAGVTRLAFTLERSGKVVETWIQHSSGSDILDSAALDALDRSHLPPIPTALPDRMEFVIEIDASLLAQQAFVLGS